MSREAQDALYRLQIPATVLESLNEYALTGRRVGHCLTGFLTNDLYRAIGHADPDTLAAIRPIYEYIYNRLPAMSHGNPDKYAVYPSQIDERLQRYLMGELVWPNGIPLRHRHLIDQETT